MITYSVNIKDIDKDQLKGFFIGWPNPPSEETFLKMLQESYKVVIAIENNKVVGFINAISDGILSAYIPLLEVLPDYQNQGIGKKLLSIMKNELCHLYMIDLLCDEDLIPYYEKEGMKRASGACLRNYENQNGYNKD